MNSKRHLLVIDPTAFTGGSKIATENMLHLLDCKRMRITVLTTDRDSWHWSQLKRVRLFEPKWLSQQEQGIPYLLRHMVIALNLLLTRLRFGRFDIAVGASGPGIDLALYLLKPILGFRLVQLIHGPVAPSRTIGRCLLAADEVHYLKSARTSLLSALSRLTATPHKLTTPHFQVMQNGLPEHAWPSRCQTERPIIFWAASLLKWKGLETLLDALKHLETTARPETHICYIRPKEIPLPVSDAPVVIDAVHWHENPRHLDEIRASSNIFVSTSRNEPFGLSILEAMAAGHCVLIPADDAYWDRTLKNGIDCIKYTPGDAMDLAGKLRSISSDMERVRTLGAAAARMARDYRAQTRYAPIKNTLEGMATAQEAGRAPQADTETTP